MLTRDDAPPPMNLSTAIRLGAMLKPQGYGLFEREVDGVSHTCALGAAANALGREYPKIYWERDFAVCALAHLTCPGCGGSHGVVSVVLCLNDEYRWTREQIADWIEGLEAAQSTEQPPSTNAVREDVGKPFVPLRV